MSIDHRTDIKLIQAARRDNAPFGILFERHASSIYSLLRARIQSDDICRDLTAETFAIAWEHRSKFRPTSGDSALPWLRGIAHNLLRMWSRSQHIEASAMRRLGMQTYATAPTSSESLQPPDVPIEISLLPDLERQAVVLRVVHELPYSEVAQKLGCSQPAARMRVMRGLRSIRQSTRNTGVVQ